MVDKALENALEEATKKPGNPESAYWLGKVYAKMGKNKLALTYFEQAFNMMPHIKQYRKDYFQIKKELNRKSKG